jgi:hypothetical protein
MIQSNLSRDSTALRTRHAADKKPRTPKCLAFLNTTKICVQTADYQHPTLKISMADPDNRLQHNTPKRAKVRGAIKYMEAKGIPHYKEDVFRHNKVSYR